MKTIKSPVNPYWTSRPLIILLLVAFSSTSMSFAQDRPDVLMIIVDDMNDSISLFDEDSPIQTSNLERLAERGTLFTRAYCISPACNPSRAATLTGLRPTTSGVYGNRTDWRGAMPDRLTLMQQFANAGYEVKGAGKVFHHHLNGAFHDSESFHDFQSMREQNMPPKKLNQATDYGSRNTDWGVWPADERDTIDYRTVDFCIEQIRTPPADKPLFLTCGIFKPHSPFFAPAEYHLNLDVEPPNRMPNDVDDLPEGARSLLRSKSWFWQGMTKLEDERPGSYQAFVNSYAACCKFADAQIGRLMDALDDSPRKDQTIVVLWSDHGFHLGEKQHIEKFALWEKTTRVPFIIVAPGVTNSQSVCESPVDLSVVYPTLLELCELPSDDLCDGKSIVSLLRDPNADWQAPAVMTYGNGNHAVRDSRWRYIRYADGTEELYDHNVDPNEYSNLATDADLRDVIERLKAFLPLEEATPFADLKRN